MKSPQRGKKTAEPETDLSQVRVQLKPVFGVRPGTYLTAIYALAGSALLFFLLVYPGLRSHGTYVSFASRPSGAAVLVDGVYRGATPVEVLVPAGQRKIEISLPRFEPALVERSFRGPVLATLVFKPRERVSVDLSTADLAGLLHSRLEQYSDYAHEPKGVSLAETARILTSPGVRSIPGAQDALLGYLAAAMPLLASPAGDIGDFLRAHAAVASNGGVLSPAALLRLTRTLAMLARERDSWAYWVMLNIPGEAAERMMAEPWFAAMHQAIVSALPVPADSGSRRAEAPVVVAGVPLRPIPGGVAVIGDDTRALSRAQTISLEQAYAAAIEPFFMGETEVTNRQYAAFLAEAPLWRKGNLADLLERGLAGDRYLEDWEDDSPPAGKEDHPVASVPFPAAKAYCAWLQGKLPPPLAGLTVRLPYEAEWEWAARGGSSGTPYPGGSGAGDAPFRPTAGNGTVRAGSTSANGYGLREVMGNVWEWCEDWYAPAAYLMRAKDPARNPPETSASIPVGSEKVVRGGSWANDARQALVYTRGSQPPSWTTPYLGFRVVAAPRP